MENKIRKLLTLIKVLAYVLFSVNNLEAKCDKNQIMRVNKYLSSFKDLSANFVQLNSTGKESLGEFFMKRPGHMKLIYARPNIEMLYENGRFTMYDKELEQKRTQRMNNFILRAILDGKIQNPNLTCKFITEDENEIIVSSIARYDILHASSLRIIFHKLENGQLFLSGLENQNKDDYKKITFKKLDYDLLPESIFTIEE